MVDEMPRVAANPLESFPSLLLSFSDHGSWPERNRAPVSFRVSSVRVKYCKIEGKENMSLSARPRGV
jgi:hypothetical protein